MAAAQNHLIEKLPPKVRTRLLKVCETVDLTQSAVLERNARTTGHVYFPVDAFISLVASLDGEPVLEVGMAGREGMVGAQLVLGVRQAPLQAIVQGPGAAWRIPRQQFGDELARTPALRDCLNRYLYVLMSQLALAATCIRFHQIGPRLARWLLMTHDRAHVDTFGVTHVFLAYMLGVRRVGVTVAAGDLARQGLIEYHRGAMTILNRKGLENAACSCYAADRRLYSELFD